ncbi:chloride channel [Paraconiothyrium brasiliense]|uniref:Chloride channel protein n=1 Tax=Paraconiothyrium brasiliense TaxID=300254 RepID=A0ABR3RPT8_9PLEO
MSSSSSSRSAHGQAEASSSRSEANRQPVVEDDLSEEYGLLDEDPLGNTLPEQVSFKRKQKATASTFGLPRFLSSPLGASKDRASPLPRAPNTRAHHLRSSSGANDSTELILNYLDTPADAGEQLQDTKDANGLDWYVEGPGRRVGYDDLTAIDWIFEYAKERQRLRYLYSSASGILGHVKQIADASQIWIILIAAGVLSGGIAAFIDVASDWLGDLKTGYCSNVNGDGRFYLNKGFCCWGYTEYAKCNDWHPWSTAMGIRSVGGGWIVEYIFFVLFSVLFAACASLLVREFSTHAKHSGIAEIKTVLGGFVIRRFLGVWTLIIKTLGLNNNADHLARKREVLSAAAAAGISVAFGSPIGGVLFSLEQLSYYFPDKTMWQSFVCAMVAAVTLQAFNPFRTGKLVLYQVTYHSGWHDFELIPFAFLGVLGGLYGGLFTKLNMRVAEWRNHRPYLKGPVTEVVIIAVATAMINYPIKFMRAQASELVYFLFAECVDLTDDTLGLCKAGKANTGVVALLLISAGLGIILASFTFGLQIPAGIILPSMAIGGLYGRAVGLTIEQLQQTWPSLFIFGSCEPDVPCVTPGTYAIIGAASALGGVTRMTVSLVVIMFELTGALTYVLPIMIAVMISKWVGDAISPRGIYESWIHFNGYPFLDNRDDNSSSIPDVPAAQVMTRIDDLITITATGHTIASLRQLLSQHRFRGFPVIDSSHDALLLGYISRTELAFALKSALSTPRNLSPETEAHFSHQPLADPTTSLDLRPWMDQTPITLNAKASFQLTYAMFMKLGLRYVIFTERGTLKGLLTKKDVWFVLDGVEDRDAYEDDAVGGGRGVGRVQPEDEEDEGRGLLARDDDDGDTRLGGREEVRSGSV